MRRRALGALVILLVIGGLIGGAICSERAAERDVQLLQQLHLQEKQRIADELEAQKREAARLAKGVRAAELQLQRRVDGSVPLNDEEMRIRRAREQQDYDIYDRERIIRYERAKHWDDAPFQERPR